MPYKGQDINQCYFQSIIVGKSSTSFVEAWLKCDGPWDLEVKQRLQNNLASSRKAHLKVFQHNWNLDSIQYLHK